MRQHERNAGGRRARDRGRAAEHAREQFVGHCSAGAPTAATRPPSDVLASFGIDNLFNQYCVQYMNAEGQSAPGQPPAIVFPSPGITFKDGLKIRFGA